MDKNVYECKLWPWKLNTPLKTRWGICVLICLMVLISKWNWLVKLEILKVYGFKMSKWFYSLFSCCKQKKIQFEFHHLLNDLESSKFHIYHVPNFHISHGFCFLATLDLGLWSWQKRHQTLNLNKLNKLRSSCNCFLGHLGKLAKNGCLLFLENASNAFNWHFFSSITNMKLWVLNTIMCNLFIFIW